MPILKFLYKLIIFVILTVLTQIGGVLYLILLLVNRKYNLEKYFRLIYIGSYCLVTFACLPTIAPWFGREKIVHSTSIQPTNIMTVFLNRNYVQPEMNDLLKTVSKDLKGSGICIQYLDANFPFWDGFPLLPHLSHNDGLKLDLSLVYETDGGEVSLLKKSNSGYGVFEEPKPNEYNQIEVCKAQGYFQYDYPKYLTFGEINEDLVFSEHGTKVLLLAFLRQPAVEKVFIEPHLKSRLNLSNSKLRYQGCKAVRHDDHIHIQLKEK